MCSTPGALTPVCAAILACSLNTHLLAHFGKTEQVISSRCRAVLQESERLISTVLSVQPRTSHTAGAVSNDELVASTAQDILANLPAALAREDASIARDPFAPLPTGAYPYTHASLQ